MSDSSTDTIFNTREELVGRRFSMYGAPYVVLALDPAGGGDDNVALHALERELWASGETHDPDLRTMFRYVCTGSWIFPNDALMPDVVAAIISMVQTLVDHEADGRLSGVALAVECNGVGWGYFEMLRRALQGRVVPITTTGGMRPTVVDNKGLTMPRQPAADHLRTLMETHTWKVRKGAHGAESLYDELMAFIWKGRRPEAAKGKKDDQVLAAIIAAWVASKVIPLSAQMVLMDTRRLN